MDAGKRVNFLIMEAFELRIGNIVGMGVHHCTVNSIHTVPQTGECFVRIKGFIQKDEQHQVYLHQLDAIPLTPEILEACGFSNKHHEGGQTYACPHIPNIELLNIEDSGFDLYFNGLNIKHLHQFQNLIFVLTGQELIYKP